MSVCLYTVSQNTCRFYFYDNFGKRGSIFTFFIVQFSKDLRRKEELKLPPHLSLLPHYLQLFKFWPSCAPGGATIFGSALLRPARSVCVSPSAFYIYRQDAAKRQTAGIKFTHRPKIRFFALQGRLVTPIHVKLGRADGHVGPLVDAKFHLNRHRGVGIRPPKYQKFPLFGKESPHRGDFLDRFRKLLGIFIRLTILH